MVRKHVRRKTAASGKVSHCSCAYRINALPAGRGEVRAWHLQESGGQQEAAPGTGLSVAYLEAD